MPDNKTITIQGVQVDVAQPYEAGHQITEAEAKALNQVRAENIANNQRNAVKKLLEEGGATAESVQPAAQASVSEYDAGYEFTLASVGGGSTARLDPLTKECRAIARNFLTSKIKEAGMTLKEYKEKHGEDNFNSKVIEISENPKVVDAAKKALKEREKMANLGDEISV